MIDTVSLLLERGDFIIAEPKKFNPNAEGLIHKPYFLTSKKGFMKCVNNPTKKEIAYHGYLPRLTLIARQRTEEHFYLQLKIEFSAPKILFGNNFDELENRDLNNLIKTLNEKLKIMGIVTTEENLINASVSSIHFSKNILLDNKIRCFTILNELKKINLNKKLDLSHTDYRNDGHAVRYHTNSYQLAFYDKLKDLEKSKISEKRAIENDNFLQLDLYNKLNKKQEVLRMEVRLVNKSALKRLLNKIDMNLETNFSNLVNCQLSRKILIYYFNIIWDNWFIDTNYRLKPEDLFLEIESKYHYKPSKILKMIGSLQLVNSIGITGFKNLLSINDGRSVNRLLKEIKELDINTANSINIFQCIMKQLDSFKKIELKNY